MSASELETYTGCRIDGAAMQIAVRQAVVDLRVHNSSIGVEFRGKLPIEGDRISIERGARRLRGVGAIDRAEAVLKVVIVTPHHIQFVADGIFRASPKHLLDAVVCRVKRVVDVCVVDRGAANTDKVARNIIESSLQVARGRKLNPFIAAVQFEGPGGVSGQRHDAGIVGNRRGKNLRQERR